MPRQNAQAFLKSIARLLRLRNTLLFTRHSFADVIIYESLEEPLPIERSLAVIELALRTSGVSDKI